MKQALKIIHAVYLHHLLDIKCNNMATGKAILDDTNITGIESTLFHLHWKGILSKFITPILHGSLKENTCQSLISSCKKKN